jgi:tRNA (cmo5U34)-methyltransferase
MNKFDARARDWDKEKKHMDRSIAIAADLKKMIPLNKSMKALEFGAGTGILSFLLKDEFSNIVLMDSSQEMINVCKEKVEHLGTKHIKPVWIDIEHSEYSQKFDIIYNQMVLHHVNDIDLIIGKFYSLLNLGGYLAIADLYAEDGSFHGPDVEVHPGFNPSDLAKKLGSFGFKDQHYKSSVVVKRENGREYPVFLMVAKK